MQEKLWYIKSAQIFSGMKAHDHAYLSELSHALISTKIPRFWIGTSECHPAYISRYPRPYNVTSLVGGLRDKMVL